MTTTVQDTKTVHDVVRKRYAEIAEADKNCGCSTHCCGGASGRGASPDRLGYSQAELGAAPEGSNLGLGCGNPLAIASLRPGQTVLDLGSGAGFDAFLAARAVGDQGRVIGVDTTPAMVSRAQANAVRDGYVNVEFRLGEIEALPVAERTVDVILSNCVVNLSPDKRAVFREAWRVLKPGGRLAISDIVALKPIPVALRESWELYTGCVAGAAQIHELEVYLREAGFESIRIQPAPGSGRILEEWFPGQGLENHVASATVEAVKPGV